MRRTQADRQAEAARAQQITEQRVQDRKTGEYYNPKEAFDKLMNKPEILASLKRLSCK